jgi:hypothetical protein
MKNLFLIILFMFTVIISAQSKIAITEDGKKVLLNSNNTWQYIDSDSKKEEGSKDICNLGQDYKEPKTSKNVERLRNHVAVENDCKNEDIKFINIAEERGNGMYSLCVKGKYMKYRMIGTAFLKAEQDPFLSKN